MTAATKALRINPKFRAKSDTSGRLDQALDRAFKRHPEWTYEFAAKTFQLEIAQLVRALRSNANLSQSKLAARSGVPQSFIARLENPESKKRPNLETISKVVGALGKRVVLQLVDTDR
jgi:ribosome-binding protein aMBF1 (putative translation factor)